MARPSAPDIRSGHFHTAPVADNAPVFNLLILTAGAFPVFNRTKNLFTEEAVFFGFKRTVVYRLRFLDFTVRRGHYHLRGRQGNGYRFLFSGLLNQFNVKTQTLQLAHQNVE